MCKVIVKKPEDNVEFIIYNHLYSRVNGTFTIDEIVNEMRNYHLSLSPDDVQSEINNMIRDGIIIRNFGSYTRVATA